MRPLNLTFVLLLLVFVPEAIASHFRGAAMVPSVSATGLVTVTTTSFWRRDAPENVQPILGSSAMIQVGTTVQDLSDIRFIKLTQVHTFQLPEPGLYQITAGSCCRVGGIQNAGESGWAMESAIFWNGTTANTPIQFNFSAIQPEVVRGSAYPGNLGAVAGPGVTLSYNQNLNVNISLQPPGFTINPTTGALFIPAASTATYADNTSGNPGADYAFSGNILASDGSRVEFDWLFDAVDTGSGNLAPTVTDVTLNAAPGQTVTHTVTGTDPNNNPLTFSFVTMLGSAPAIAPTFNASTRVFTWNTTGSPLGTYLAQFQASDGFLTDIGTATINLSLSGSVQTPTPLALTSLLPTIEAGSQLSYQFQVSGGAPPYTFSATGLPASVILTPTGALVGNFSTSIPVSFTITINDTAGNTLVLPFNIQIAPRSLTIGTFSVPEGTVDETYSANLRASGGTPPYSWSKTTGTLPPGLDLDSGGRITGIPTSAGNYQFGAEVSDSGNGRGTGSFTITVKPPLQGLLQISESGLSFEVARGGAAPPVQSATVTSGNSTATRYTMHRDGAPWLTVGAAGGITPGNLTFSVNPEGLAPGEYISNTLLRGPHNNVSISVRMRVQAAAPPELSVSPALLRFDKRLETQTTLEGHLNIANSGGGGPQNVGVSIVNRSAWLKLTPSGTQATPSVPVGVRVEANTQGLPIGAYYDVIRVTMGTLSEEVPVSLFISPSGPNLSLDSTGIQFQARQGNGTSEIRDISVTNLGPGSFSWTAEVVGTSPWLKLATIGSTVTPTTPGILRISVDAQPLAEGAYYGLVRVNAPGTVNTPQFVLVVLNVVPPSTAPHPSLSPAGLLFVAPEGGNAPAAQNLRITASSAPPLPFQAAVTTATGGNWLSVTPRIGTISTQSPGVVSARVNAQGLKPGFYFGEISFTVNNPNVRTANVLLVVTASPAAAAAAADGAGQRRAEGCTPSTMAPLSSGLVNNFSVQAGWPTPLSMRLVDNCGEAVRTAQAVVSFSNGDPPIVMPPSDPPIGLYSATWTPLRAGSQIAVSVQVTAPGLTPLAATLTGTVNQNQAPVLAAAGTVNIFHRRNGAPLAPGMIVEVYGSNLAVGSTPAASVPLPKNLGGTTVLVGGVEAPLYFASTGQVNAQIPTELAPNREYQVLVSVNNALAGPETITLTSVQPAIAALPGGRALAQHADFSLIDNANPVRPGGVVILYLTGMGATNPPVASATPAPRTEPLARVVSQPTVTVDGQPAEVFYAGLTPDAVGLYQITLRAPQGVQAGDLNVVVTQEGVQSNTVTLPVRRD
ncbi:MAG: putative Ig domain-containing protein [Bryobacteraceae bacterium]